MIQVHALKIQPNVEDRILNELILYVSEEKQNRIKRFAYKQDALRVLYGDILTRLLITKNLNIGNKDIIFKENAYKNCHFKQYTTLYGYKLAICSEDNSFPENILTIDNVLQIHQIF